MLVRLLGQEDAARKLTYTAPFTDLAAWEQPYIQYLYDNGLTQGTSATSWSPEDMCDARMYAAFLLRSLGYSDTAGDFAIPMLPRPPRSLAYMISPLSTPSCLTVMMPRRHPTPHLQFPRRGKRECCSTVSLSRVLLTWPLLRR